MGCWGFHDRFVCISSHSQDQPIVEPPTAVESVLHRQSLGAVLPNSLRSLPLPFTDLDRFVGSRVGPRNWSFFFILVPFSPNSTRFIFASGYLPFTTCRPPRHLKFRFLDQDEKTIGLERDVHRRPLWVMDIS